MIITEKKVFKFCMISFFIIDIPFLGYGFFTHKSSSEMIHDLMNFGCIVTLYFFVNKSWKN
ncbi:hypothetical protein KIMC2_16360 [Xylocopilactobacillus apis]|uniref:Uncharacterized protein n=1 Tax=Xylocopilactobacillus apis TaxID=2932183 RepID=A0AAU9CSU9_9LACO|nr:hypothetical protein KIMC2_16360 [Xylocopilactobacillus apis]